MEAVAWVFGRLPHDPIHTRRRQAYEKRQWAKSREVGRRLDLGPAQASRMSPSRLDATVACKLSLLGLSKSLGNCRFGCLIFGLKLVLLRFNEQSNAVEVGCRSSGHVRTRSSIALISALVREAT